ncbi:cation acetate symporter [Euzebya sp.]|uniref:sodium/solute symporter n=1 Tax=Euzebya sp. TaxID=1971409 RepID=UPI003518679E
MTSSALLVLVALAALGTGVALVLRPRRASTIDYYLAGQRVGVLTNASAICGDYISAASFLGVAAAVYASGLDGAWYAAGFTAGFVPIVLFVAAPLRRFGGFSVPDFLGRRMESHVVRLTAVAVVMIVIGAYVLPQVVGTGLTWQLLTGVTIPGLDPYGTGVVVNTAVITALVVAGGMRGTTWTQAVQFIILLVILLWLTGVVTQAGFRYPDAIGDLVDEPLSQVVREGGDLVVRPTTNLMHPDEPATFGQPGGRSDAPGQLALVLTLVLGTSGLPHVLNRFFTAPTGRSARTTAKWVLVFASSFYILAVMLGIAARTILDGAAEGRPWLADLMVDGVLAVPEQSLLVLGRLYGGTVGLGVVTLGALVAVMSTMAGLLLAAAASVGHDLYEQHVNRRATTRQALIAGRMTIIAVALVATVVALAIGPQIVDGRFSSLIAQMVTWALAIAGSALTPALILAIWWPRVTAAGLCAGMLTATALALTLIGVGIGIEAEAHGLAALLLTPTPLAATVNLVVTVVVSLRTTPPPGTDDALVRMHGTGADRRAEALAELTIRGL